MHEEGIFVTVPGEAEEAVVFLAPETGGAFSTLRAAVRGKPGAFVRAVQDLEQASLDRARLEKYLDAVRESWLIEDRWWTEKPLRRFYWEIVTTCGRNEVVFEDLRSGRWWRQR